MATHWFEFDKLEFARPSRMNKVFILFSTQIAGLDIMFTVFEVPTVCFCRREQKERAYAKLGVPFRTSAPANVKVESGADKKVRSTVIHVALNCLQAEQMYMICLCASAALSRVNCWLLV